MFARTTRLTLRPAWPEDAAAIAAAIGHESVARMLHRVPFPYEVADADAFAQLPRTADAPRFVILSHERTVPEIVGGIAIHAGSDGHQLAYWLAPPAWGRGYATEAGRAVIDMARHALPIRRLGAWHFADNPASGRVLRKLGFTATGHVLVKQSAARAEPASAIEYDLDLDADRMPMPMAA